MFDLGGTAQNQTYILRSLRAVMSSNAHGLSLVRQEYVFFLEQ